MTREAEEEEVRSLLSRHQERIILDLSSTDLLAILVKNSVLSQAEEDLLLKSINNAVDADADVTKRKLSAVVSNISAGSSNSTNSRNSIVGVRNSLPDLPDDYTSSSITGSSAQSDSDIRRSVTPIIRKNLDAKDNINDNDINSVATLNDVDALRVQCNKLIDIIAKNGFEKFKQFCYAIENECPQLIEDLINDRLKCDTTIANHNTNGDNFSTEYENNLIDGFNKDNENGRNERALSYGSDVVSRTSADTPTLPRAAPRRVSLMKEPPPPPPPKPVLSKKSAKQSAPPTTTSLSTIQSKYPQTTEYNLIQQNTESNSVVSATATEIPLQNLYANTTDVGTNYSSLLCHATSSSSPPVVRKREKLLHRFSDAATLGRKLKKKKNTNRTCRSMTEPIEILADPVIEDEFFGDRTSWEYSTVSVTRVPGYGFGIAVSGGRDNPHFANGDPSIAVSDVLKGGPAEDRLQVNDRIISVNNVSLENVEYATAVQVLRDSGNTVTLVVKRRVPLNVMQSTQVPSHQHSHSMSSVGLPLNGGNMLPPSNSNAALMNSSNLSQPSSLNTSLLQNNTNNININNNNNNSLGQQPIKVTLSKGNKKDDFGIVLGCRLYIKEITSKTRDQLAAHGYSLQEGDIITRIHNTNCGDSMSIKEAKKIIDGCKERLNLVVYRDVGSNQQAANLNVVAQQQQQQQLNNSNIAHNSNLYGNNIINNNNHNNNHQAQESTTSCSNNLEELYLTGNGANYSSQNLYVQPPTRTNAMSNGLNEEKSNLTPRGRSRGPITDGLSLTQLDRPVTPPNAGRSRSDEPPRPPPPRSSSGGGNISDATNNNANNNANEDFYSSRRQLYEDDSLNRTRQTAEPRFISFQKEGSVGIRLTGGNEAGIFVTAVQPGSPASLQGLTPGDKILKVNDMDMHGVTREEAVLFLLSLQDRIDLIVQYCKEEYDEVVKNQRGDSFHIKTHFHCENPSKGEIAFKAGDVFRVIDTLHNGVVGSWQVLKIGRGHQEMQRGVIPNKSRAEELATAQFNATKKEMNANESRGNFFRRRRSTHRRSKSLSRDNWDDVVFSDSISKFPAYERVVLRHPGFVRPVVLFGPISDLAREKLAKDFTDKFSVPLQDDDKANAKCRIVRLSNIRDIMDRGKHALLDITPNAVDRLNYAQFYPIVIFLKTDSKHVIKQLRQGLPKAAHKSSKKLLEQCQKLERVWSHIFSTQIVLNDEESWYRKLREAIDLQQSGAVWMSEAKPVESLSDDFLFPMTTSRLSYASSPESDLELSPGPSASLSLGNLPQLVKSNSDPSIATNQDNLDNRDRDIIGDGLPPPYTIPYEHGTNGSAASRHQIYGPVGAVENNTNGTLPLSSSAGATTITTGGFSNGARPQSLFVNNAPDLPPRIDRHSKPGDLQPPSRTNSSGGTLGRSAQERLFGKAIVSDEVQAEYISRTVSNEAAERQHASLERQARLNAASMGNSPAGKVPPPQNDSYESVSSYDSYNTAHLTMQNLGRLGPNAPDDLKSVPNASVRNLPPVVGMNQSQIPEYGRNMHDPRNFVGNNDLNRHSSPGRPAYHEGNNARNINSRNGQPQRPVNLPLDGSPRKSMVETKTDYGKYSRNNSTSQADYSKMAKNSSTGMVMPPPLPPNGSANGTPNSSSTTGGSFKPVPPPKPKNYRPPMPMGVGPPGAWENGDMSTTHSPNGYYYPPAPAPHHYVMQQQPQTGAMQHNVNGGGNNMQPIYGSNNNTYGQQQQQPQYAPPPPAANGSNHHYNGGSGTGPYIAPHRGMPPPIANIPPHPSDRHALDLAGSREQRGSAFELYRKPQIGAAGHHHNMSEMEPQYEMQRYNDNYYSHSAPRYMSSSGSNSSKNNYYNNYPPPPPPQHPQTLSQQQQYYSGEHCLPPPLPPHKPKKKSMLKSPLTAIKNALIKTTRPLRRMNSMVEPERKPSKSALKRQHSMLERQMQRPYYPDEYPTYPAGFEESHYQAIRYQRQQQQYYQHYNYGTYGTQEDAMHNSTYQNLGAEDIYGNIDRVTTPYEHADDLYANRALIDLERRQAEAMASGRNGRRIVRRHSTTTADRGAGGRGHRFAGNSAQPYVDENGHKIHATNNYGMQMERAPNSEIMSRRRFHEQQADSEPVYQTRREMQREMQRHHLQQSKQQMQQRIQQGKREMEREMSSHSCSSHSERGSDERESVLSCPSNVNRDIKELREQIYQTRRETLESMAEPIYVASSKREMPNRPEPIYECKEESILQSRENETDEKKEEVQAEVVVEINHHDTQDEADLQQSSDTLVEDQQTTIKPMTQDTVIEMGESSKAPLVQSEDVDDELSSSNEDEQEIEKEAEQNKASSNKGAAPKMHISELINKQNIPPPPPPATISESAAATSSSQMSISTQASVPVGPPNATSTPYTSNMSLPVAGPVTSTGPLFPAFPREPKTTRGVFDSNGGTLCDPVWNVSLQIPAGAIASGVQQEIYFTVSDPRMGEAVGGPPLDMENGETMLSPLVMCGPQGLEFLVPVTLNIPHCAGRTASLGLALKATDSEKQLHTEWDNIDLPSNAAAHTVSVKVDHF